MMIIIITFFNIIGVYVHIFVSVVAGELVV